MIQLGLLKLTLSTYPSGQPLSDGILLSKQGKGIEFRVARKKKLILRLHLDRALGAGSLLQP
jgi:hypothetical protein